ncbi:hypothetical protein B9Z55_008789 [Caenorhabditis nigoni]|uniref:Uncharacterized protein n=2 Tax=Caenorhabditis nigoni TaxID=1611254 RepID=A0A2G5UP46_9PELO|nr:hypothetical protein B9Z55_008789 [Caenorhabditis nigoni]
MPFRSLSMRSVTDTNQAYNWVVRLTKQDYVTRSNDIWDYPGFLGVLVSNRHIIFGHRRAWNFDFKEEFGFKNNCRDGVPLLSPDEGYRYHVEFVGFSKRISDKRYYYGNCNETDGIIIVELQDKVDFPEACFPVKGKHGNWSVEDYDGNDVYENGLNTGQGKDAVVMANIEKTRPLTNVLTFDGNINECPNSLNVTSKYCYTSDQADILAENIPTLPCSQPLFHRNDLEQYFFIGLGHRWDREKKQLPFHDFRKEIDVICDLLGVCPPPPTTTAAEKTTTTTTVATTTVTVTTTTVTTTTTDHVPEFLFDEEARDFEEPYNKTSRRRKGAENYGKFWILGIIIFLEMNYFYE